jgi:hypothetical protein
MSMARLTRLQRWDFEMRIVSVVACVAFFAGTGSALAADCNKGMLWPFVRTAGDCLTDPEIASGKTGVYSGPVNTNVDVSAIKPSETPAQSTQSSTVVDKPLFSSAGNSGGGALISSISIFGGAAKTRADTDAGCTKGTLWPFKREPGDCLTADEKKAGRTGVYGGGAGLTQISATNTPSTPAPAPAQSTPASAPAQSTPAPAPASCGRSWLWPFVRKSGDCPSEADKQDAGK